MLRFYYVIIVSMPWIIYYVFKIRHVMKHQDKYSTEYRYGIARNMVRITMRNARIKTNCYGMENLPKEGGYVMYPNHQGKLDALSIIHGHDLPCSIAMELKRSKVILTNEFVDVLDGIRLDRNNLREQLKSIRQMAEKVRDGRKFILFPEGGYANNGNQLQEFLPGAFKVAKWSKMPIVPVAVVDSYKSFGINSLRRVITQVHFLKPVQYEEYKDLNTKEIAELVKGKIQEAIEKALANR